MYSKMLFQIRLNIGDEQRRHKYLFSVKFDQLSSNNSRVIIKCQEIMK